MSAPAFAWALERGATLDLAPADRLVLIYLADMANGEKVCWPSQGRIEHFTGLAPRTVRASLHRLADMLLIRVETRPGYVCRYHILRDTPVRCAHPPPANRAQATPANGAHHPRQDVPTHPGKSRQGGGHISTVTPANGAHDPSKTQEKKPLDARETRAAAVAPSGRSGGALTPVPSNAPASTASNQSVQEDVAPEVAAFMVATRQVLEDSFRGRADQLRYGAPAPTLREQLAGIAPPLPPKPLYLAGARLLAARRAAGIPVPGP